jgi:hypothetical protein
MSRSARQATPLAAVVAVTVSAGAFLTACGAASSPDPAQPAVTVTVTASNSNAASQPAPSAPTRSPVPSPSPAAPATFGDSARLVAGDVVLAIGNPLGLSSSVTEGIVSAVGRTVSEPATRGTPGATLPDTIQTSAAINPGNSGGALATLDGAVVGIPTLAAASQAGAAAPGIGFAISSNIAVSIATQLVSTGRVTNRCSDGCPAAGAEDGR